MISFDEAVERLTEVARPLGRESVPLGDAAGRVLAAPVVAMVDSPPADSSSMDGYAVREADLPGPLRLVGESFAGGNFEGALEPGTCVRIFTGAPVPAGTDRIVIQEIAVRGGDVVTVDQEPGLSHYIRPRGSDFRTGDVLLEPGRRLDPRALVTAAAADVARVDTWRVPAVLTLATGDELVAPGEARRRPGTIPESVSLGIMALAEAWGGGVLGSRRLTDDLSALVRAAGEALEQADLVVVTGGASVGEKDHAQAMFAPHGLEPIFSKVAMKPGKPVWLGRARGKLVLGLPGNPTSAMVTARLLLAPLAGPLSACGDRETFHRARRTEAGVVPLANQDSGAQKALTDADLLLRSRPNEPPRQAGEEIEALNF